MRKQAQRRPGPCPQPCHGGDLTLGLSAPSQALVPVLGHSDRLGSHLLSGRNLERHEARPSGPMLPEQEANPKPAGHAGRWLAWSPPERPFPPPPGACGSNCRQSGPAPRTTCTAPIAWLNPPHPPLLCHPGLYFHVSSSGKASWTLVPAQLPALRGCAQAMVMGLWEVCHQCEGVRLLLGGHSAALGPRHRAGHPGHPGQLGHGCQRME